MTKTVKEPLLTLSNFLLFIGAVFVVFIVGVGTGIAPIYTAIFSLVPIFIVLACLKFRIAVLVMLVLASGLIPKQLTPTLPMLGGRFRAEDMFLALLIGIGFVRLMMGIDKFKKHNLWYPLYYFSALVVCSLLVAFLNNNKFYWIVFELRGLCYWFFAMLLVISIKDKKQFNTVVNFIVMLSALVAAAATFQSITGIHILTNNLFSSLFTGSSVDSNVNRSFLGGFGTFVAFSFVLTFARLVRNEIAFSIGFPVLLVLLCGIIVTFGRGFWIVTLVTVFISSVWLGWKSFIKIWTAMLIIIFTIASFSSLLLPDYFDAVINRAASVSSEIDSGESWGWRKHETAWGLKTIKQNPFIGIGLGGEYLPPMIGNKSETPSPIPHNSYIGLALKFGLAGLIFPVWLTIAVLLRAKKLNTTLSIAIGSSFMNPVLVGYSQMEWAHMFGIMFMATMVALLILHEEPNNTVNKPVRSDI